MNHLFLPSTLSTTGQHKAGVKSQVVPGPPRYLAAGRFPLLVGSSEEGPFPGGHVPDREPGTAAPWLSLGKKALFLPALGLGKRRELGAKLRPLPTAGALLAGPVPGHAGNPVPGLAPIR